MGSSPGRESYFVKGMIKKVGMNSGGKPWGNGRRSIAGGR